MPLPSNLRPLRLSRRSKPFYSDDWIVELKHDGFRALAFIESCECRLVSRNGKPGHRANVRPNGSNRAEICGNATSIPALRLFR